MRIGIGAILGTLGGPATYARELVGGLARIDHENEYVVLTDAPGALRVSAPNVRCVSVPLPTALLQPVWDHVCVPRAVRRHRFDLYHGTKGTLPLWCGCPQVVTIHDLAVYHQPETFAWLQRLHQRSHLPFAVRGALRVIAVSEYARSDLLQRFALLPQRVVAVPLAAGPRFSAVASPGDDQVAARLGLPRRFILYAGTVQPRKQVEVLVAAFAQIDCLEPTELLIAGRLRPGYHPAFVQRPPRGVRYLGPVTDAELAVLYRRALALCSPSTHEGFGLSLLEAMASGCLVVAGCNSAVPELVGQGGVLLPRLSLDSVRDALSAIILDPHAFDGLRAVARQRAATYSWDETARRTLEVYRQAVGDARATV